MNNWVYYDLETTDADASACKIVEMCFASEEGVILHTYLNPGRPIQKQATEVHGITPNDVLGALPFKDYANEVQQIVEQAEILIGFNNYRFDSVVLDRELMAAGMPGFKKDAHGIITQPEADLFTLWGRHERRTLATAAKRFAGVDLENAHSADADTTILPTILAGMVEYFQLGEQNIVNASQPEGAVDREGKFIMRESDGIVVFSFGKHSNKPVHTPEGKEYMRWMLNAGFSPEVKAWCRRFLNG